MSDLVENQLDTDAEIAVNQPKKPSATGRWKEVVKFYVDGIKLIFEHKKFFLPLIFITAFFDSTIAAIPLHSGYQGKEAKEAVYAILGLVVVFVFHCKYFQFLVKGNIDEVDKRISAGIKWKYMKIILYILLMMFVYFLPALLAASVFALPKIMEFLYPGSEAQDFGDAVKNIATVILALYAIWFVMMFLRMSLIPYFVCIDNDGLLSAHNKSIKIMKGYKLANLVVCMVIFFCASFSLIRFGFGGHYINNSMFLVQIILQLYPMDALSYFTYVMQYNALYLLYKKYKHLAA